MLLFWFCLGFLSWEVTTDSSNVDLEHKENRHSGEWKMTDGWTCSSSVWVRWGLKMEFIGNVVMRTKERSVAGSHLSLSWAPVSFQQRQWGSSRHEDKANSPFSLVEGDLLYLNFKFFLCLFLCLMYSFWYLFFRCKNETSKPGSPVYYTCLYTRY